MKKVSILLIILFASVLFLNFIKTEDILTKETTYKNEWLNANLKHVFDKQYSYSFDKSFFIEASSSHNIKEYRFVLGLENDKPIIICKAITNQGEMLSSYVISKRIEVLTSNLVTSINPNETFNSKEVISENISKHLLTSKQTKQYLHDWTLASKSLNTLNNAVSFNGQRIKHFTIKSEAIEYLVNKPDISKVDVIFGQNSYHKMTTVIVGRDNNLKLLLPNSQNFALDFTRPCPTACDPVDPKIIN